MDQQAVQIQIPSDKKGPKLFKSDMSNQKSFIKKSNLRDTGSC